MFYELPSTKMSRASGIGYGSKCKKIQNVNANNNFSLAFLCCPKSDDFTKSGTKTPAPNTYDQKIMTIEAHEKHGWSFGLSREVRFKNKGNSKILKKLFIFFRT
jgi:hypothetical protein